MPEYPDINNENPYRNEFIEIYCAWINNEHYEETEPSENPLTKEEEKDMEFIQKGTLLRDHPEKITHILNHPEWIEALKLLGNKSPKEVMKLLDLYAQNIISNNEMDTICLRIKKREIILQDPLLKPIIEKCKKNEWENVTPTFLKEYLERSRQ